MTDKRIIFMSRDKTVEHWFVSQDGAISHSGNAEDSDLLKQWSLLKTDVVLTGNDVTIKMVDIPGTNTKQRLKAAPFAIEEQLATDVDAMHFSYQVDKQTQAIQAAAIERTAFEAYLSALQGLEITPDRMIPLACLLDTPEDCISVMQIDEYVLINDGASQWVTGADAAQIQLALVESEDQALLYWGKEEAPAWLVARSFNIESQTMLDPWASLVNRLDEPLINLLSGPYAPKSDLLKLSKHWRRTLQFAASLVVLHLVYMAVELTYLSQAKEGVKEEITALYHEVAPGARVVNARRQMQQLIQQRQGSALSDSSFAMMLQSLTEALQSSADVEPTNLNYSAQNSELRVDLLAGNLSQFDRLKQTLEQTGYRVTMGGATAQGQQYSGRIVIRSGP